MKFLPILLLAFVLSLGAACSSKPVPEPTPVPTATAVSSPIPTPIPAIIPTIISERAATESVEKAVDGESKRKVVKPRATAVPTPTMSIAKDLPLGLVSEAPHKDTTQEPTTSGSTATPTEPDPPKTLSATPVLNLPFTTDHEPIGMMPMGETILHPATPRNPNGHPGIDFQWPSRGELIAATNGEVAEIRTSKPHGSLMYSVLVISGDFVVVYNVVDIYSVNPDLDVGSEVVSGQVMGYAESIGSGDGWTSTHWSFGKWRPGSEKPNPEGVVEKFRVDYRCPVPYFSETERLRLFRLWEVAKYPNAGGFEGEDLKKQFPDICNGPYKNY